MFVRGRCLGWISFERIRVLAVQMRYIASIGELGAPAANPGDCGANAFGFPLDPVQFVQQRTDTIVVGAL